MKTTRNNILYYAATALIIETAAQLLWTILVFLFGSVLSIGFELCVDMSGYFMTIMAASMFVIVLLVLLSSLAHFYVGFAGRKNANNPQMGGRLYIFGIIMLVLSVIALFWDFSLLSLIHFVIVALYTVGAYELKTGKLGLSQYFGQAPKDNMDKDNIDKDEMDKKDTDKEQ